MQAHEMVFENFSGIRGPGRAINCDGVAVQVTDDRSQATALIVTVIALLLLIAIQVNVSRINIEVDEPLFTRTDFRQKL